MSSLTYVDKTPHTLTEDGSESPCLEAGDEWPSSLAEIEQVCENPPIAPCQLNRVWAFGGQSVPPEKARPYHWIQCYPQARCKTRWGAVPAQTFLLYRLARYWPTW